MNKKLTIMLLLAMITAGLTATAQENDAWRHKKYLNLSWVNQTLSNPEIAGSEMKSDFAVSLAKGRTYYLHKTPIAGIMKFGIDWTQLDFNYARYSDGNLFNAPSGARLQTKADEGFDDIVTEDNPITSILTGDWGKNQIEYSMHLGASLTVNPVDYLKVNGYFRWAPTLSALLSKPAGEEVTDDLTVLGGFGSFWIGGGAISYKVISLGIETRWGTVNYKHFNFGEEEEDASAVDVRQALMTNSTRIYLSFRF